MNEKQKIIIGLDESNKGSIIGKYYFSACWLSSNKIQKILKKNIQIGDSKKISLNNSLKLTNIMRHNFVDFHIIHSINSCEFDLLLAKYSLNINDLTMLLHLITITKIQNISKVLESNNFEIIIDDFMANKKNKTQYLLSIFLLLKKILSDKIIKNWQSLKIFNQKHLSQINFIIKADQKNIQTSIASQIAFCYSKNNYLQICKSFNLSNSILEQNKNNYEKLFSYLSEKLNNNQINNFFENEIRVLYPQKSKQKAIDAFYKFKLNEIIKLKNIEKIWLN